MLKPPFRLHSPNYEGFYKIVDVISDLTLYFGRTLLSLLEMAGSWDTDWRTMSCNLQALPNPLLYRHAQFLQSAFEKMIAGFDADQLLWIGEGVDERFEFAWRSELVTRAADEEFGLGALAQEPEIVSAVFSVDFGAGGDQDSGQAEGNERRDTVVGIGGAQSDSGSKGKAAKDYRERKLAFEPIEGGAHVFNFADAVGVLAFAQSGAAEIKAQHGESEVVERLHGVEDDFVVQRAAKQRMRMANHRGVRRVLSARVEQRFQASGRTVEE